MVDEMRQTSVWIMSKQSVELSSCDEKGGILILPNLQVEQSKNRSWKEQTFLCHMK